MADRLSKIINHLRYNQTSNDKIYRYAVFNAGPLPKHISDKEGSHFQQYKDFFTRNNQLNHPKEEWICYDVTKNEFPTHNELLSLSGIMISGSSADAFDNNTSWVVNLRQIIHKIVNNSQYKHVKLIGLCFGHQVIAHSLSGGKVYINPLRKNITDNWEMGTKTIVFNENFYKTFPYFKREYGDLATLKVLEHHRDAVISVPKGAILLATSKYTANELYVIGDRILSFQGHPEFEPSLIESIIKIQLNDKKISRATYDDTIRSMKRYPNNNVWSRLFSEWLRR
eukprot:388789_1